MRKRLGTRVMDLQTLRYEYKHSALDESHCDTDPFKQFDNWFTQAIAAKPPEPNAMVLSTVSTEGQPSARAVLLKSFDHAGFVFFTNYESQKGRDLAANPKASLLFYWGELERQIRIEGVISKTTREVRETYFSKRPRNSQLGALCSPQSRVITREALDEVHRQKQIEYPHGVAVPCPNNWGGFIVNPHRFEFWQGRESRLHDRIEYSLADGAWSIHRLAP